MQIYCWIITEIVSFHFLHSTSDCPYRAITAPMSCWWTLCFGSMKDQWRGFRDQNRPPKFKTLASSDCAVLATVRNSATSLLTPVLALFCETSHSQLILCAGLCLEQKSNAKLESSFWNDTKLTNEPRTKTVGGQRTSYVFLSFRYDWNWLVFRILNFGDHTRDGVQSVTNKHKWQETFQWPNEHPENCLSQGVLQNNLRKLPRQRNSQNEASAFVFLSWGGGVCKN